MHILLLSREEARAAVEDVAAVLEEEARPVEEDPRVTSVQEGEEQVSAHLT
jgi:hypothetical protein